MSNLPPHSPRPPPTISDPELTIMPTEAHTAVKPNLVADKGAASPRHEKSQLLFRRLREERPLPGPFLAGLMLAALFMVMVLGGWNDASQGPLLPSLQNYYHVNYLVISLIWIVNFLGFLSSGIANVYITDSFGFGIAAPFGSSMQALGYALMCWGPPFPVFVIAYYFNGFGLGLQDAQVNSLTSRLPGAATKMFLMHAFYGLGATISPLISTEFVKKVPKRVYLYFCVSLGLALVIFGTVVIVFQGRTEDQVVGRRLADVPMRVEGEKEVIEVPEREGQIAEGGQSGEQEAVEEHGGGSGGKVKAIMTTPSVHYMAFYLVIYVGVEVTIGGWATTFLLDYRGGTASVGYVTTGYFAGLTLGRVILIPVTKYIGNHNSIYIYTIIAIALELVVWFVDSLPGNAVCYALVGFVLGPMYPVVMNVIVEVLPGELHSGTIGWCASLGQAGSAMLPFITGAISNRYGVWILQPFVISFMAFSLVLWFLVPRPPGLRV